MSFSSIASTELKLKGIYLMLLSKSNAAVKLRVVYGVLQKVNNGEVYDLYSTIKCRNKFVSKQSNEKVFKFFIFSIKKKEKVSLTTTRKILKVNELTEWNSLILLTVILRSSYNSLAIIF